MVAQAVDTYGKLDVLVNNAGIVRDTAIWNMGEDDFDAVIRVHLKGTWAPSHHAARHWRDRAKAGEVFTGRVINTTSGAGLVGNFGQTNYATAKAGIAGFTQTLSLELYKLGVTVNAVGPAAATRITGTMPGAPAVIEADEVPEDEWNRMDPAVSSPLVAWLACDESQLVTGQVIRAVAEDIVWMQGWSEGPTHLQRRPALGRREARPAARHRRLQAPAPPACATELDDALVNDSVRWPGWSHDTSSRQRSSRPVGVWFADGAVAGLHAFADAVGAASSTRGARRACSCGTTRRHFGTAGCRRATSSSPASATSTCSSRAGSIPDEVTSTPWAGRAEVVDVAPAGPVPTRPATQVVAARHARAAARSTRSWPRCAARC